MFFNAKQNAARQDIFQELSDEQLTQAAGGNCSSWDSSSSSSDSDKSKSSHKYHHHHHKHHHHWHKTNKYSSDWKKNSSSTTYSGGHW